jgi:predicted aspartyl protease
VKTIETSGTIAGEGLTGDFHSWRNETNERDDERLGPRLETTLRLGDRIYLKNSTGNVRELKGYLRRRALTQDFVDSGAFVKAPERSKYLGPGTLSGRAMWRIEVNAAGGEPETLWIDSENGLPVRLEYLDGDGPSTVDFSDWRKVEGRNIPFKSVTSDGEHAFDVVELTTGVQIDKPIAGETFAPLTNRIVQADGVQTVPLTDNAAHVACTVMIGDKPYSFIVDTGSESVLIDSSVAKAANIPETGSLELRGATRSGGLHVLTIPRVTIGTAHLDNLVATSLDLSESSGGSFKLDGILGYPFFASSIVEMDFANHTMRFGPPGSFVPRGVKIDLDLDRGLLEALFSVNGSIVAPFIVDTGNSAEVLLYRHFIEEHPGVAPRTDIAAINRGLGGGVPGYVTSLGALRLGGFDLYHPTAYVQMSQKGAFADRVDAGNVGLGVLKNFVVTFDLTNSAMYLEKSPTFDDGRSRKPLTT